MLVNNLLKQSPNCFEQTMFGLDFIQSEASRADLFSRTCIEQFLNTNQNNYNYQFAQVFEPYVLKEICKIANLDYDSVDNLRAHDTAPVRHLNECILNRKKLNFINLMNVAATLVSISRFKLAKLVLEEAKNRTSKSIDRFEVALLEFIITNRAEDGKSSDQAFTAMRLEIETGDISPARAMDACSHAIVWHIKTREISESNYKWFLEKGTFLAKNNPNLKTEGPLSSWYRAIAMIPAAEKNFKQTREYMLAALESAELTISAKSENNALNAHLKKTYFESTIKEHLYVTNDRERAEEAGNDLISFDPHWSPSYGELAEVHQKFKDWKKAALVFEKAAFLGPPYFGHHLFYAAQNFEKAKEIDQAMKYYTLLSDFDSSNKSVVLAGLKCSRVNNTESLAYFEDRFLQIKNSILPQELAWLRSL